MMDFVDKLLDLEEVTKARKVQLQKFWERGAFTPVHRQEIPKGSQIFSHKWLTSVPKEHPSHASHALTSRLATQHHFVSHEHTVTTGGFRAVFWEPSKDLREAVDDIVGFLNYLRHHQQAFAKGATTQLLVLCNRTAVHNMLLHHGFHHAWEGGIRVSTTRTSRESNHHRQSVSDTRVPRYQLHHEDDFVSQSLPHHRRQAPRPILQLLRGFLSGGRRHATLDDKEDRLREVV